MKKSLHILIKEDNPLYRESVKRILRLGGFDCTIEKAGTRAEFASAADPVAKELRQSNEQLHALASYLQYLREEERIRIAREVHDELGQRLTGMKLSLAWLARRLSAPEFVALSQKVKALSDEMDATLQTVRRIATELRPQILDDLGLVAAIEWQAGEFQNRTEIRCHVFTQVEETPWDQDFVTVYFRIFQEMLTNIIRHANATEVDVRLTEEAGRLVLEVRDNGRGITAKEVANTRSIGLIGMRERAALVGGEITFAGAPGTGTTVRVRAPLPAAGDPAR